MRTNLTFAFLFYLLSTFTLRAQNMVIDTFYYTGHTQTFVIPQCSSNFTVLMYGAQGGIDSVHGGYGGNYGARVYAVMNATPGALLYLNVGGSGHTKYGGWNGGGNGGWGKWSPGGGGGGSTDIRIGGNTLTDRIFVAAGGGGSGGGSNGFGLYGSLYTFGPYGGEGGSNSCNNSTPNNPLTNTLVPVCPPLYGCGGGSGYTTGAGGGPGSSFGACNGATVAGPGAGGGGGGMQSGGGVSTHTNGCPGTAGVLLQGGSGGDSTCVVKGYFGGGGGGGGYYGGGGGHSSGYLSSSPYPIAGGGGGGSSYLNSSFVLTYSLWGGYVAGTYFVNPATGAKGGIITLSYYINGAVSATSSQSYICAGQQVTLTAGGVNSYTWLPAGNFVGSNNTLVTVSPNASTQYTVKGFNSTTSCLSQTVVNVNVMGATPSLTLSPSIATVCLGSTVNISASGAGSYTWNTGQTGAGIAVSPTASTIYTVLGSASGTNQACTATKSLQVLVYPVPTLTVTASPIFICAGEQATLNASGALTYTWTSATNAPVINYGSMVVNPQSSTIYTVTGSLVNTCKAQSVIAVQVDACLGLAKQSDSPARVFPNPNNGKFYVYSPQEASLRVFTALGQLVTETQINAGEKKELNVLAPGIYFLHYQWSGGESCFKLLTLDRGE